MIQGEKTSIFLIDGPLTRTCKKMDAVPFPVILLQMSLRLCRKTRSGFPSGLSLRVEDERLFFRENLGADGSSIMAEIRDDACVS